MNFMKVNVLNTVEFIVDLFILHIYMYFDMQIYSNCKKDEKLH